MNLPDGKRATSVEPERLGQLRPDSLSEIDEKLGICDHNHRVPVMESLGFPERNRDTEEDSTLAESSTGNTQPTGRPL